MRLICNFHLEDLYRVSKINYLQSSLSTKREQGESYEGRKVTHLDNLRNLVSTVFELKRN